MNFRIMLDLLEQKKGITVIGIDAKAVSCYTDKLNSMTFSNGATVEAQEIGNYITSLLSE